MKSASSAYLLVREIGAGGRADAIALSPLRLTLPFNNAKWHIKPFVDCPGASWM